MGFALVDDGYDEDEKIEDALALEPAAIGFHVMAIAYCNRRKTDGRIRQRRVDRWLSMTPYTPARRQKVLKTLLELRLFERHEDGDYMVHNFLSWNRSRAERDELAQAGRKGGLARAKASAKPRPKPPSSPGQSQGHSPGSRGGSSTPRLASPREAEASTSEASKHPEAARLSRLLADMILVNEPKASVHPLTDRWVRDMRLLLADRGGDAGEVESVLRWCQADQFWHSNILSPGKLRAQFTQLALKASAGNVRHLPSAVPEHLRSTPEHDAQIRAHLEAQREGA